MPPPTVQPDDEDAYLTAMYGARLAEQDAAHPGYRRAWETLEALLLPHGGRHAVPPMQPDQLVVPLVKEGAVHDGSSAVQDTDHEHDCHRNVANLWRHQRCDAIGTGYALSDDGLWREHSWAVRSGQIVETTVPRLTYFGIVMTGEKATWFADWVDPPD